MAALTTDISDQGFCLEAPHVLAAGSPIDGYVLHGDRELDFRGEVSWSERASPQASMWSRMGVRFSWVSPGLRALLSIEQRRRER
ncbi:MAG: PilZ domain-containing protein [Deltaproteobacteria bacterium]|nr:PilZ domain-containing protein [Deltaproteobacteria bacterium]